jgi:iron complex outermembrane receptor protein
MMAQPQGRRWKIALLAALVLCTAWAFSASAMGSPNEKLHFDIDAGDAVERLNEFGAQSYLSLMFPPDDLKGIPVAGVHGEFKPIDALQVMLKGTDITYHYVNRRMLTFRRTAADVRPAKAIPAKADGSRYPQGDRRALDAGLEEVTIRTAPPSSLSSPGAPLVTVNRADIDATGFVTAQGVIRTLPQIFGGGPTEDTNQIGSEARSNTARGSGVNLRGLGAGSTLVLMNGSRLAGGGSEGVFVDISNLPLAAVERIDILPDNSSTFYGADAVGGVVNFVMRDEFNGEQTEAFFGNSTRGQLSENYVSQIVGGSTNSGHGLLTIDFYSRDNLTAASRDLAHSDLTKWGGTNFDSPLSNPGNIVVGQNSWSIPKGQDGTALTPSSFQHGPLNLQDQYKGADILPSQQRWSTFGTWRQRLADRLTVFGDVMYGQRNERGNGSGQPYTMPVPVTNAFFVNPTGTKSPVFIEYNFFDDLGPMLSEGRVQSLHTNSGLEFQLDGGWEVKASAGYSSEHIRVTLENQVSAMALTAALASGNRETAFNPFGDGTHTNGAVIDSLRASSLFTTNSSLKSAAVLLRGPLMKLPGGDVTLAIGGDAREQAFSSLNMSDALTTPTNLKSDGDRTIHSVFAELQMPIVGPANRLPGVEALSVALAERREDYSDFGLARTPRLGLAWAPLAGLTLRGTYSESFRPPGLLDLDESRNLYALAPLRDPRTGALSTVLVWGGKNRDLRDENARSWTAGLELEALEHPGTALAITYFSTVFSDRLNQPAFTADLLSNPALSALITRNPTAEYREEVCSRAPLAASGGNCLTTPIVAIADLRFRNDAIVHTQGFDLLARYLEETAIGRFSLSLNGTYIVNFAEAKTADSPLENLVSTPSHPINLKMRGTVRWQRGNLDVSANANYLNHYRDTASVPERNVASWTTLDLQGAYTLNVPAQSRLANTTFSLGIENAFDTDPPFMNNVIGIGYDQENGDLTGRTVNLTVRKTW